MSNLQIIDEVGCPLPAGVQVSIYGVNADGFQLIGTPYPLTGVLTHNGNVQINWPLPAPASYIAYFVGNQAPKQPVAFSSGVPQGPPGQYDTGLKFDSGNYYDTNPPQQNPTSFTVPQYRSPIKTGVEYGNEAAFLASAGWYNPNATLTGGVLHSVMRGLMGAQELLDNSCEIAHESLRLGSCIGSEIDSWALDMVGPLFARFNGETDANYLVRIGLMIGRPRCTINAIQAIAQAFYNSIAGEPGNPLANDLAFNTAGGFDATGAFDTSAPGSGPAPSGTTVFVWDSMTQPSLATEFGIVPTQFVIQVGRVQVSTSQLLAMDTFGGYNTQGAFDIVPTGDQPTSKPTPIPPDWRLGVMIGYIGKLAGTQPMYLIGSS